MSETIKIGDSVYQVCPATPAMAMAIRSHLKATLPKPLDMLAEMKQHPAWSGVSPEAKSELEKEAITAQFRKTTEISDDAILDLLMIPANAATLAWLVLKDANTLTIEKLLSEITAANVCQVVWELIDKSGFGELGKNLGRQSG